MNKINANLKFIVALVGVAWTAYMAAAAKVALEAAAPLIAAAERDRITQMLDDRASEIMRTGKSCGSDAEELWAFARLMKNTGRTTP